MFYAGYPLTGEYFDKDNKFICSFSYRLLDSKRRSFYQGTAGFMQARPYRRIEIMTDTNHFKVGAYVRLQDEKGKIHIQDESHISLNELNPDGEKIVTLILGE